MYLIFMIRVCGDGISDPQNSASGASAPTRISMIDICENNFAATRASLETSSTSEAIDVLQEIEKLLAWTYAQRQHALVAVAGKVSQSETRGPNRPAISDVKSDEVACALNITANNARNLVANARVFVGQLPQTLNLLATGTISEYKARIVCEGFSHLLTLAEVKPTDSETIALLATKFQNRVLGRIETRTPADLRRLVRQTIARLVPAHFARNHQVAKCERKVFLSPAPDGMAYFNAFVTELEAARMMNVLEKIARDPHLMPGAETDSTDLPNKMADILVGLVTGDIGATDDRLNELAQVQVVVSLETLLGASQNPGEIVETGGLLSATSVRELATTSRLRRLIVDPTDGRLLEFGRTTYRPPQPLRDKIIARDRHCRAPGCNRPAIRCDLDHRIAWQDDGHTGESNLFALCRRHHILKTVHGHRYRTDSKANVIWQTPSGREYETSPPPVLVDPPPVLLDPAPF